MGSEPVEEAVGVVKGLRKLKSVSRTGQSDVVLEFAWGTDMDQASLEVRDKMEIVQLPLEAEPPVLLRFNPSTEPIMRLVLAAKGGDDDSIRRLTELRRYADDDLKKKLKKVRLEKTADLVQRLTLVKTPEEIGHIKKAAGIAAKGYKEVLEHLDGGARDIGGHQRGRAAAGQGRRQLGGLAVARGIGDPHPLDAWRLGPAGHRRRGTRATPAIADPVHPVVRLRWSLSAASVVSLRLSSLPTRPSSLTTRPNTCAELQYSLY